MCRGVGEVKSDFNGEGTTLSRVREREGACGACGAKSGVMVAGRQAQMSSKGNSPSPESPSMGGMDSKEGWRRMGAGRSGDGGRKAEKEGDV